MKPVNTIVQFVYVWVADNDTETLTTAAKLVKWAM